MRGVQLNKEDMAKEKENCNIDEVLIVANYSLYDGMAIHCQYKVSTLTLIHCLTQVNIVVIN